MSEIIVVYWSGTGNTETMAQFVGKGIQDAGKNADVVSVSEISPETLKNYPVFALGCPSMGSEELEEMEMEPFVEAVEGFALGKKIGLFGSYGWGDGEWMRIWTERMQQAERSLSMMRVLFVMRHRMKRQQQNVNRLVLL